MNPLLESLTGVVLRDPHLLWVAALAAPALWLRWRRGSPALRFAPASLLRDDGTTAPMPRSWRVRLLPLPRALEVAGLLLLVLALARPVERVPLPHTARGIDILLCVDGSSSMAENDMDPRRTRLDLAVAAAARFVADRPGDRIGLLRFARYPDVVCPLTLDHGALGRFLADLEMVERDGPEDRTGIGRAVARAAQVLADSRAPSKVVVLLTDGEENVATADTPEEIGPLRAAQMCEELGVRVYTIAAGIGRRTESGEWVPIDTGPVRKLAERTGGAFYEARDGGALGSVYATIDALEETTFEEPRFALEERYLPVLLGALLLMAAAWTLERTALEVLP